MNHRRWLLALLLAGGIQLGGCDVLDEGSSTASEDTAGNDGGGPVDDGTGNSPDDPPPPPPDDPPPPPPDDPPDEPPDDGSSGGIIQVIADVSTDRANDLHGLAFAADGKIYAAGHHGTADGLGRTVVGRFNADGSPDPGFGEDGFATVNVELFRDERSAAIVELAGGDVLVAVNIEEGRGGQSVYLLRFDASGTQLRAPEWGDGAGKVEVVFGWENDDNNAYPGRALPGDTAWDMLLDGGAGERVVILGSGPAPPGSGRSDQDRYVVRLTATDGSPDPAFNGGQPFSYHSARELDDLQRRGLIEPDGSIVSAGYTNFGDDLRQHLVLIKLTAAGEPDPAFGNIVMIPAETAAELGLAPRPGIAILNPFSVDGGSATSVAVAGQSNGSYVTTGFGAATGDGLASTLGYATTIAQDLVSFRLGSSFVDTSWGTGGTQAVQSEGSGRPTAEDRGWDLVALADDRSVHVGRYGGNSAAFVLTADGVLDQRVDGDGIIELGDSIIDAPLFSAALSADGIRIAATTDTNANGARLVVLEAQD